jgi:hypothetical protein
MVGGRIGLTAAAALALALGAACRGPVIPSPVTGGSRYLCCNMHYENPEISDVNYQVGTLIPFGTQVQVLEVRRKAIKFQPAGHPPILLLLRYGENVLPMETYAERLFVAEDPRTKLKKVPAKTVKLIEAGGVDPGMTKDQVLMSLGYPPAHRTPSLETGQWSFWQNRWQQFVVYFDGDKVSRVQR